jgi:hypothetical protein
MVGAHGPADREGHLTALLAERHDARLGRV